jgi:ubiquinol-cytochrome c reductase iron-sulfur subunit
MSASADVLALASAEFKLDGIAEGTTLTVKWRGKPVFIRHRSVAEVIDSVAASDYSIYVNRTDEEVEAASKVAMSELKDPAEDKDRYQDPKWYVVCRC